MTRYGRTPKVAIEDALRPRDYEGKLLDEYGTNSSHWTSPRVQHRTTRLSLNPFVSRFSIWWELIWHSDFPGRPGWYDGVMDEPACPGCRGLLQRVAELEARVAELTRKLDEAVRAGRRQAAPFRKGPPKPDPKTPGRKSGDAHGTHGHRPSPTEPIAECHEAQLPDACPHGRGRLVETSTADQFQTEIPRTPLVRKFRVHIGHCEACGKRAQGRHPLQTSDALGAAASQIGPDAQAAATLLHTRMGLSHGKVASIFRALFGITLTRGASVQIGLRAATRLEPDYQLVLDEVRRSEQIAADETGWRIGGRPAGSTRGSPTGPRPTASTQNAAPRSWSGSSGWTGRAS
jgi:hypothetical protein